MKVMNNYILMAIASTLALTACGGDSESSGSKSQYGKKTNPVTSTDNAQEWLDAHNTVRKKHQVSNLTWSDKLAKSAKKFASTCPTQYSNTLYGENMAFASYVQQPKNVVKRWYEKEEIKYNYTTSKSSPTTGHFTQIVWKGTTKLGCAQVSGCGGKWSNMVVCQYNPSGNVTGEFAENVFQPK